MRAYALSVQNQLKGGAGAGARASLETLKSAHGGHDLYYPDGTSFTETMELVLGLRDRASAGQFSLANVNGELKADQLVDKGKAPAAAPRFMAPRVRRTELHKLAEDMELLFVEKVIR